MTWQIYQTITINCIRVNAVTNSSVLQIGSAGSVRSLSQSFNTGGFTQPAPQLGAPTSEVALVRLPKPT